MEGWIGEWMDKLVYKQIDEWDVCIDGILGWINGWVDGGTDK